MPLFKVEVIERITNVWTKKIEAVSLAEAERLAIDLDVSFVEEDSDWVHNEYHHDVYECDISVTE